MKTLIETPEMKLLLDGTDLIVCERAMLMPARISVEAAQMLADYMERKRVTEAE